MMLALAAACFLLQQRARAEHANHVPVQLASSVRFDPPLEGRVSVLGHGPLHVVVTPSVAAQATLNRGSEGSWVRVSDRITNGEPLRVWILGASPSCGHHDVSEPSGGPPEEAATGLNHTFGGVLLTGLRALYPGNHEVTTECHGGAATDRWIQEVAYWRSVCEGPFKSGTDVVVIETGLTDGDSLFARKATEILLRQLFAEDVAVIMLSSAGVRETWMGARPRLGDAAYFHREVALHYGVHQVSPVDAFEHHLHWLHQRLRSDTRGHPSIVGHDIIGCLLLHAVVDQLTSARWTFLPDDVRHKPRLAMLAYNRPSEAAVFIRGHPKMLRLDEGDNGLRGSQYWLPTISNWTLYADGRDRGLIAHDVGSSIGFFFPPDLVHLNFRYRTVVLTILKTYEGMGSLRIRIEAGEWRDACRSNAVIEDRVVDTLWENRYSEPVAVELRADKVLPDGACFTVNLEIVASEPPRLRNKVKLYSIAIF